MVAAQARAKADAEAAARAQAKAKDAEQAKKSFAKSSNRLPPPPEDDARPTLDGLLGDSESFVGGRGVEFRLPSDEISSAAEPPPAKGPDPTLGDCSQFSSAGSVGGSLDHHHSRPSLLHSEAVQMASQTSERPSTCCSSHLSSRSQSSSGARVSTYCNHALCGRRVGVCRGRSLPLVTAEEDEPPPPPLHEMHHIHLPASRATHVPPPPPPGPAPDTTLRSTTSRPVLVSRCRSRRWRRYVSHDSCCRAATAYPRLLLRRRHRQVTTSRCRTACPSFRRRHRPSPVSAALALLAEHSAEGSLDHHHSRPRCCTHPAAMRAMHIIHVPTCCTRRAAMTALITTHMASRASSRAVAPAVVAGTGYGANRPLERG